MAASDYYPSYTVDQVEEYKAAFERDGFVVVDNVLTQEEIAASAQEVFEFLAEKGEVKADDPATWEQWPREICRNGGFMGRFPYYKRISELSSTFVDRQPQAWRNRENPKMHQVFANLLGTRRLWVSVDRYGIMRPTRVRTAEGEVVREDWLTKKDWLHWDLSPFHGGTSAAGYAPRRVPHEVLRRSYGHLRVQGLLTISDCRVERGGFHCVKSFRGERFFQWVRDNEAYGKREDVAGRNFVEVPDDDPMRSEVIQVPMRAGSLLVWDSQLPHGNFPNTSDQFRIVQYVKMIPVDDPREFRPALQLSKYTPEQWFGCGYEPSELGRKLLGLEEWEPEPGNRIANSCEVVDEDAEDAEESKQESS